MKTVTGILLIAHAPLASAFARAASDIGFPVASLAALDMGTDMSREQAFATATMLLADLQCDHCLVLTDLGGCCSPVTVAQQLRDASGAKVRIVTGLNMPMLATALCSAHQDVGELARCVAQYATDSATTAYA
jgi:mannose/fructose-specific phosphotransferase system component IIA